ncbi:tumor necrosis factor receptor superfamily member 10B-like [Phacochoerus africanus]|uniref:tumor necrosis factor receptor superfamily member 10B-like n=1 Tax=Phacochoerus africanus TaxID=41426 RepID=UPI001FDA7B0C|nr:tumor necrosis factor receptor superfamily member 10B-like [Phacochoerus africanus]
MPPMSLAAPGGEVRVTLIIRSIKRWKRSILQPGNSAQEHIPSTYKGSSDAHRMAAPRGPGVGAVGERRSEDQEEAVPENTPRSGTWVAHEVTQLSHTAPEKKEQRPQPLLSSSVVRSGSKYDPALQERRCRSPMALPAVCLHRDRTRNWGQSAPTASGARAGRAPSPQPSLQDLRALIVVVLVLSVSLRSRSRARLPGEGGAGRGTRHSLSRILVAICPVYGVSPSKSQLPHACPQSRDDFTSKSLPQRQGVAAPWECPAGFHVEEASGECVRCTDGVDYTSVSNSLSSCLRCTVCKSGEEGGRPLHSNCGHTGVSASLELSVTKTPPEFCQKCRTRPLTWMRFPLPRAPAAAREAQGRPCREGPAPEEGAALNTPQEPWGLKCPSSDPSRSQQGGCPDGMVMATPCTPSSDLKCVLQESGTPASGEALDPGEPVTTNLQPPTASSPSSGNLKVGGRRAALSPASFMVVVIACWLCKCKVQGEGGAVRGLSPLLKRLLLLFQVVTAPQIHGQDGPWGWGLSSRGAEPPLSTAPGSWGHRQGHGCAESVPSWGHSMGVWTPESALCPPKVLFWRPHPSRGPEALDNARNDTLVNRDCLSSPVSDQEVEDPEQVEPTGVQSSGEADHLLRPGRTGGCPGHSANPGPLTKTETFLHCVSQEPAAAEGSRVRRGPLVPADGEDPTECLRQFFDDFSTIVPYDAWDKLMRKMGLTQNEILQSRDRAQNTGDALYEMLETWVRRKGREASVNDLLDALAALGQRHAKEKIEDTLVGSGKFVFKEGEAGAAVS